MKRKGFTLTEFMVVVTIMIFLSVIAYTAYKQYLQRASAKAMQAIIYECITGAMSMNQYTDKRVFKCEFSEQKTVKVGNTEINPPTNYVYIVLDKDGFFDGFSPNGSVDNVVDTAEFIYKTRKVYCQKQPIEKLVYCN
ncbi:prepilin-type N-terminal cleavage/methylation domain-containing protein [Desulfurobacterium sp.]|uniref:type IV pilin protein n=1 Tax=Desulfurobacterium sp. TaxID=2004706 RepID=UPI00260A9F83|nr:prepilin-type N-terminal cleavage/methylation domain-containing protein [Desulfurobacterium sp.]